MISVNKAIIVGRLGNDPELKYTQKGTAVANMSVATTSWKKGDDGKKLTEWHRVTCWGKTAEFAGKYLQKGDLVCVEGEIQTRKWTDKEGIDRYITEIHAREVSGQSMKSDSEDASERSADRVGPKAPGERGGAGGRFNPERHGVPEGEEVPF